MFRKGEGTGTQIEGVTGAAPRIGKQLTEGGVSFFSQVFLENS